MTVEGRPNVDNQCSHRGYSATYNGTRRHHIWCEVLAACEGSTAESKYAWFALFLGYNLYRKGMQAAPHPLTLSLESNPFLVVFRERLHGKEGCRPKLRPSWWPSMCKTSAPFPSVVILTWQWTKKSLDTGSLVRVVLGLRHIWQVTYSTMYLRSSDSMYFGTYLPDEKLKVN